MNKKLVIVLIPVLVLMIALLGILGFMLVSEDKNGDSPYMEQLKIAQKYLEAGDYENAILYYRSAMELDSTQEEPYLRLADIYMAQGNRQNALEIMKIGYQNTGSAVLSDAIYRYTGQNPSNLQTLEGTEGKSDSVSVKLNNDIIDILSVYTYKDYQSNMSYKSEKKSNGSYSVTYTNYDIEYEYINSVNNMVLDTSTGKPYSYARPTNIRIKNVDNLIYGVESGVTADVLKKLGASNVVVNGRNATVGSEYISFTYRNCNFIVACNSDGVVLTSNCYVSVIPPKGEEIVETVTLPGYVYTGTGSTHKISGARVVLRSGHNATSGTQVANVTTNSRGEYSVLVSPGKYTATVSAKDYVTRTFNITVPRNAYTYNFELVREVVQTTAPRPTEPPRVQSSAVSGSVIDVTTGEKVSGASLVFRSGYDNRSGSAVATKNASNGTYSINLAPGRYTVEVSASGYNKEYTNITIPESASYQQDFSISPVMRSEQIRIVLEWGEQPYDLDSHLYGDTPQGDFHVYFGNSRAVFGSETVAELDVDDTNSYGPETITLNNTNGTFSYRVHQFSSDSNLANSGAVVKVYMGNSSQPTVIRVPSDISGRDWNVFEIVNGQIVNINGVVS